MPEPEPPADRQGDKEFFGARKIETEGMIIPAKSPYLLDFLGFEFQGFEIYPLPDPALGLTMRQLYDDRQWPRDAAGTPLYHHPITDRAGLKPGDRIVWKNNPLDYLYDQGIVSRLGDGPELWVQTPNGKVGGSLAFGADSRGCWVCTAVANLEGLNRVDFS